MVQAALVDLEDLADLAVIVHFPVTYQPAAGVRSPPVLQVCVGSAEGDPRAFSLNSIIVVFWIFFNPVFMFSIVEGCAIMEKNGGSQPVGGCYLLSC